MDRMLRFCLAALVFCVVAGITFAVGLQFVPSLGEDGQKMVMITGVFGLVVLVMAYGPLLAISAALGGAFAAYVYGKLGPSP
jgi:hypothetical protein